MAKRRQPGKSHPLAPPQLQAIAELFAVLSEPSRLCILQVLRAGEASVGDLVEKSGLKQANMSKQLGILTTARIVARRQDGNRAIYSIVMPMVFDLCEIVCDGVAKHAAERAAALSG